MAHDALHRFDRRAIAFARRHGVSLLRVTLGIVFVWFGLLKVAGRTPVADLVADVVPLLPDRLAVVVVGAIEIAVGAGLLTRVAMRLTMALFFAQMLGTFAVLVLLPGRSFGETPFDLTVLGEFVVKNLVLVTAGLVVAASIPTARADEGVGRMLARRAEPETKISPR